MIDTLLDEISKRAEEERLPMRDLAKWECVETVPRLVRALRIACEYLRVHKCSAKGECPECRECEALYRIESELKG